MNKNKYKNKKKELDRLRRSKEYTLLRNAVLERDKYECIWCGDKNNLEIDHIKSFTIFPELRFAIDNCRTLCKSCHSKTFMWDNLDIDNNALAKYWINKKGIGWFPKNNNASKHPRKR